MDGNEKTVPIVTTPVNKKLPTQSAIETNHQSNQWKMSWFLLIVIVTWLLAAMVTTTVVVCFTRDSLSLSLFSILMPPTYLLYWIAKHLFPMDEKRFQLEVMKLQIKMQRPSKITQANTEEIRAKANHRG